MPNEITKPPVTTPPAKPTEQVGLRVSLIPQDENGERNPWAGFGKVVITAFSCLLIVGGLAGYLYFRVRSAEQEIARTNAAAQDLTEQGRALADSFQEAKLTQARLSALSGLLAKHRNAAGIFKFFEEHTLADVAFSSIAVNDNASVNLAASASSFESYAAQISEFAGNPLVKNVASSGLNPVYGDNDVLKQVDFALVVTFDPAIFTEPDGNPSEE